MLLVLLICLAPTESEVGWQLAAKLAQAFQQRIGAGLPAHGKPPRGIDHDFDIVAFPQLQRFDQARRKTDGQAAPPFHDPQGVTP